jgi:UDP-N-acetylglucosamine 4,6-dehydratase
MRGGEIFVPVLPSMRILDLAEAVAPGYRKEIVGLRPGGEKLSERLLSDEEIGRTVRTGGMLVINPSHHSWNERIVEGTPVPSDFTYDSADNAKWVTVEGMREWLNELS